MRGEGKESLPEGSLVWIQAAGIAMPSTTGCFRVLLIRIEFLVSSSRLLPKGDLGFQRHATISAMISSRNSRQRVANPKEVGGVGGPLSGVIFTLILPYLPDRLHLIGKTLTGTPS